MRSFRVGSHPSPVPVARRGRSRFRRFKKIVLLVLAGALFLGAVQAWLNRPETADLAPLSHVVSRIAHLPALTYDTPHPTEPGQPFIVVDPYAYPGTWFKVQLHVHTNHSLDGRWSVAEALAAYQQAGYDFLAISDHDRVTRPAIDSGSLLLIPAEENTLSFPFWPFGHHSILLFIDQPIRGRGARLRFSKVRNAGGLVSIAHPNWVGNLGTGRWDMRHLMATQDFTLMEVYNPHSDTDLDTATWHETVLRRGPGSPVWAVAVDDAHDLKHFNQGWTMVKAEQRTLESLKEAMIRGSLYATTGIEVTFGVSEGAIFTAPPGPGGTAAVAAPGAAAQTIPPAGDATTSPGTAGPYVIRYIDALGEIVYTREGNLHTRYEPKGNEGFIRVEVINTRTGRRAWSQPFWLLPVPSRETSL